MNSIKQIAHDSRYAFEQKTINTALLKKLYKKYTTIPNIDIFLQQAQHLFPHLNCGLASVYLKNILPTSQIIQGSYKGNPHTFLLFKKTIIDITADQYGGPKIYIGPLKQPWSLHQPNLHRIIQHNNNIYETTSSRFFHAAATTRFSNVE